ncbi:Response regulator receiver domain-containing protein [Thalassobaculum litoreum DSM 18839]|uniref:Response regulator receiver domain-containing protein n=1 Tax=Thalassobaculum litoreum DSM 18839 TaxID=1123362 RepID=A0A8G2BKI2_9PROT|nr:Response regulator receiver domain-containing protein [Thalassobaculum litoreum DSM 18839]
MRKWLNHQSVRPLRRFLRALNVDTVWAEEWLRLTYASAETDEVLSGTATASAKFQVFKDFFREWAFQNATEGDGATKGDPLPFTDDRLRTFVPNLPPVCEQMLLLCDFVGFTVEEGAKLLELTPEQGTVELEEGRKLTRNLPPLPVLILEDHGLIAQDLSDIIGETGLSVIGIVANEADAIKVCRRNWPEIIVSDQMLEGGDTGLQAIEKLRADGEFATIYVTAYPDEVLTGLDDEPAVIVAKPFKPEAIRAALGYTIAARDRLGSVIDAEAERDIG